MKKTLSLFLTLIMVLSMLTGCVGNTGSNGEGSDNKGDYKVAMITDYGDITDQSFNQTTYEACQDFCKKNDVEFNYYKPTDDSTADRVASVEKAIDDGFNIIVMPGYAFAGTIVDVAEEYSDVKFIALDVAEGDLLEAGVAAAGEQYDYNPANWDLEKYVYMDNVYCAIYQEEISGYMAGYAAVKMGYEKLGFLGGMAVPAVIRFGYGFVQGAEDAAKEMNKTTVEVKYAYGNQFYGDASITASMDTWYQGGTEVVFACGGGIYTSAAEAATKEGIEGKLIGVDTDQSAIIDGKYGKGLTITSAMKGLYPTTYDTLEDVILEGKWEDYAGKINVLGLVSATDPLLNYVQIPMETTLWSDDFSQDDYKALVEKLYDGTVKVSNDISKMPTVSVIKVENLNNLK